MLKPWFLTWTSTVLLAEISRKIFWCVVECFTTVRRSERSSARCHAWTCTGCPWLTPEKQKTKMCWSVTRKYGSSVYFVGRGVEDSLVVSPKLTQWSHRKRSNLVHGRKRLRDLKRKRGKRHLERKKHSNFSILENIPDLSTFPVTLVQRLDSRWTHVSPFRLL